MSGFSDEDVRRAADLREWLIKQISDKQDELERLRTNLSIIDNLLKQGSFRAAASFGASLAPAQTQTQIQTRQSSVVAPPPSMQTVLKQPAESEVRQLTRNKDGFVLANAQITPGQVVIVPAQGVPLNSGTPPFRSFFLERILDGMKNKDAEKITQGAIKETEALSYSVDEEPNGFIKSITITNYRDKDRLGEIFNTSSWVFARMLEKSGQQQ
jgi:hypothetical protein